MEPEATTIHRSVSLFLLLLCALVVRLGTPTAIGVVCFFLLASAAAGAALAGVAMFVDRCLHTERRASDSRLLLVARVRPDAAPWTKHHAAAGFDVSACEGVTLPPHESRVVATGWAARAPQGTYLRVAERSGLAMRNVGVGAGVVDQDYTGEIGVVLRNYGDAPVVLAAGTKVAQLIPTHVADPTLLEVPALPSTARGAKGFGSSG